MAVGDDPTISSINWANARIKCWKLQGELASVPDQETKEFLTNLGNKVEHWIGGQKNEGNWTWTDKTPWRNEFWAKIYSQYHQSSDIQRKPQNILWSFQNI